MLKPLDIKGAAGPSFQIHQSDHNPRFNLGFGRLDRYPVLGLTFVDMIGPFHRRTSGRDLSGPIISWRLVECMYVEHDFGEILKFYRNNTLSANIMVFD